MRVQTEEWRRFIPGVRMYKGKKTLFYNGEKLWDDNGGWLIYDREELMSWEVIIVLPGVEVIPEETFVGADNVKTVIMADTVKRIGDQAFFGCQSLAFLKLSRNLEVIEESAFEECVSLTSIYVPQSCREIGNHAFAYCHELIIFNIPSHTLLGKNVIPGFHPLLEASPFEVCEIGCYDNVEREVHRWVKKINSGREYTLHRLCCSTYEDETFPIQEQIYKAMIEKGPQVLHAKNKIGITPLKYLEENPYLENIDEMKMLKRYIAEKMGQVVDL
ncbi:hypothetical protein CTEN210_06635 [Chaetoceros tenuissimus]|uniref:Leucine-rich repeat domain-containing protein n=1 Tax=Chaetoceros tenuissimus TaxID=426638 RepID=A0AAD3CT27_9STRA|nr:hypothetical protein CTEN210_06635 [Chaetoceros tenuissimus]